MSVLFAVVLAVHAPLPLTRPVQDKNFYVLSLLERNPAVRSNAALATLRAAKARALHDAVGTCALDVACFAAAMRFSDAEIDAVARALNDLHLDDAPLRASGTEALHPAIDAAWKEAANGINNIIDV